MQITIDEVLQWNTSIEKADAYGAYLNNQSNDQFVCKCIRPNTFGIMCEYQFIFNQTWNDEITTQFLMKTQDPSTNQEYGDTLCYETLECNHGLLCLDWRYICDGRQQCMNGVDEENCDLLEFNECDKNEFRCRNGMCIADRFWLDGMYDCMDWSDENDPGANMRCDSRTSLPNFHCDERLCRFEEFSCGNGGCISMRNRFIFDDSSVPDEHCYTMRESQYICELNAYGNRLWTTTDGRCVHDPNYKDESNEDDEWYNPWDICPYLLKCLFTKGLEKHCPCNSDEDCVPLMKISCLQELILYPEGALLTPYLWTLYEINTHDWKNGVAPDRLIFDGSLRCRGYNGQHFSIRNYLSAYFHLFYLDTVFCLLVEVNNDIRENTSMYDLNCYNESITFNGFQYQVDDVCKGTHQCISRYRLNDGFVDCYYGEDENINFINQSSTCFNQEKYRFKCSHSQSTCYYSKKIGNNIFDCDNKQDEVTKMNQLMLISLQEKCRPGWDISNCYLLRKYIEHSSTLFVDFNENELVDYQSSSITPFRYYCDTLWDIVNHDDELPTNCFYWHCRPSEYQCETYQCIPKEWVCDGEWDCPDASDEQKIFTMRNLSEHNLRYFNLTDLKIKCSNTYPSTKQPFFNKCNLSEEYPCFRNNVTNPLDLTENHPCVPLTKIGDGISDCHDGWDERNMIEIISINQVLGYYLICSHNSLPIAYDNICKKRCVITSDDETMCFYKSKNVSWCSGPNDVVCLDGTCRLDARCDEKTQCPYGEDEYRCVLLEKTFLGFSNDLTNYRGSKKLERMFTFSEFYSLISSGISVSTETKLHISDLKEKYSLYDQIFYCNRGVSFINENPDGPPTVCFCPISYYGSYCQYFSDRLTIVIYIDWTNSLFVNSMDNSIVIKIVALFLFNKTNIIDSHVFHIRPALYDENEKESFAFHYPRFSSMLEHKQNRYRNRKSIIEEHPYSIQFEGYHLGLNQLSLIGIWHYPIYFDFLPSFRLAKVLQFGKYPNSCKQNSCPTNHICSPIINQNSSFTCLSDIQCENYCFPGSICKVRDNNLPLCLCPLGRFGPRCYLLHNKCLSNPCLNNGTCLDRFDYTDKRLFICLCSKKFEGDQCEKKKTSISFHIEGNLTNIRASVVQYYSYDEIQFNLILIEQHVYHSIISMSEFYFIGIIKPIIVLLVLFDKDYHGHYHLLYFEKYVVTFNITSLLSSDNQCYLSNDLLKNSSKPDNIPPVFFYHKICNERKLLNISIQCFYDQSYLCICGKDNSYAECFAFNPALTHCSQCFSNGHCIQGNLKDKNDFICLCPTCYYGRRCQFSTNILSFTLDSLMFESISTIQYSCLVLTILIFLFGLLSNFCSFITFRRPKIRQVGVGNYLFIGSVINQASLFFLLLKIIYLVLNHISTFDQTPSINLILCKTISYILSILTRSIYWLTSCISVERLILIKFPTSIFVKKPRLAIGISIGTILILCAMHIHEIVFYTTIDDVNSEKVCAIDLTKDFVFTYNRVSIFIHHFCPFTIQIICITLLIIFAARSRAKVQKSQMNFYQILRKQFRNQRELYITPIIIILSSLPQIILSFSFACTHFSNGKRYGLLFAYLLSYLPQTLGFLLYVLPSTFYKSEFIQTNIGQFLLKRSIIAKQTITTSK
ncbi:unnamed protein product [Adineta steineri]|uniref:Uncharacterized protein n=1 Tax=Adineta steineri TaxID=433720 RepID=A0A814Q139_9BILA|nr:unnamed protein product [Adineta steineri]